MARRLRENRLGIEAAQVNLKINPESKAIQGISKAPNDLQQIAQALSGIAPQINKFLYNANDRILEQYDADAEARVRDLKFDPETNTLAEDMIKDNNNPSFLKSMEHFRGLKLARYASADYAQRYAGLATNDAGDNAFFPDQDDPENMVPSAIREFAPEGASATFMKAFNQGMAKTHHQGREFFLQQVGIKAAKDKQEAGFFFLDDAQKDPETGDYLPPEQAVESLMASKPEFLKTHSEDEWFAQMLAQGAVRANQGDTEYITQLSEMKSDLGLAFKDDPTFSKDLANLGKLARQSAKSGRTEEAIRHVADLDARTGYGEVTPLELSESLRDGDITKDEFVAFSGKLARGTLAAQKRAKASAAKTASYVSDEITKRDFYTQAIDAYNSGDKSKVQYSEPKLFPRNKETNKPITVTNAEYKAGLNRAMEYRLGQQLAIQNRSAGSPKEVAANTAQFVTGMAEFIKDSGGKFPKWKDLLSRTHADMIDSDAQMGQVDDETAAGLQIALTLRKVNPAIFNKFTTDAQRKLFDQVAAYSQAGLGELHEVDQIKSIISKVANEEATIANSKADIGDVSLKDTRKATRRLMNVGMTPLQAKKALNSGLATSRGDNRSSSDKIDEIISVAEESRVETSDGSVVFKSPEQSMGFSSAAAKYSKSDAQITLGDSLDLFLDKSKALIVDREPNQKVKVIQHPNNDKAYVLADEWGHPFTSESGAWISTTDDALAPWMGVRTWRENNLEEAKEGIFKREFDKAMSSGNAQGSKGMREAAAQMQAHEQTREIIEGYLDVPSKDLPEDVKGFIQAAKDAEEAKIQQAKDAAEALAKKNKEWYAGLKRGFPEMDQSIDEFFGWDKK